MPTVDRGQDVSFPIIAPSTGSTLFAHDSHGFPAIRKALAEGAEALGARTGLPSGQQVVIARAFDTDPGAFSQGTLLAKAPLALLEGLWISLLATGATRAIIAVASPSEALAAGIAELGSLGLLDFDRNGAKTTLEIQITVVTPSFMGREDDALVQLLAGKPAMAGGKASPLTLVQNAESLVSLATGSQNRLVQVMGAVKQEALAEVPAGTTLRQLIFVHCGGLKGDKAFKFALVGGPTGSFIPEAGLDESAASGTLVVGDESACVVDMALRCLTFTTEESCGRCILCREGSYQLKEILSDMTSGRTRPDDEAQIQELAAGLREGSLCAVGRQAADPLLTGLQHFPEEFEAHLKRKRCPALVCRKYVTFHILGEQCTGCGKCLGVCPEEAIEGEEDYIHVIDAKACTQCGLCFEICPEGAIVKAGPLKPKTPKEPIPVGTWKKR